MNAHSVTEKPHSVAKLKRFRNNTDPFTMSEQQFVKLFRLGKEMVWNLIERLEPHSISSTIPFKIKILAALYFYGHGSWKKFKDIKPLLGISQPSNSRAIHEITTLINKYIQTVTAPIDPQRVTNTKQGFQTKCGLPNVISAIDAFQLAILAPNNGNSYLCRKNYHSINVLIACDANLMVTFADASYPGSVSEAEIWKMSRFRRHLNEKFASIEQQDEYLIGNYGFPLEPWLLIPCKNSALINSAEDKYNKAIEAGGGIVKKCFDLIKNRFRCIVGHNVFYYKPAKACKILYAVLRLHSLCRLSNLKEINDNNDDDDIEDDVNAAELDQRHAIFDDFKVDEYDEDETLLALGIEARNLYIKQNFKASN